MGIKSTDLIIIMRIFKAMDKSKNVTELAHNSGISIGCLYKKISNGDFSGLIATEKKRRCREIKLTPKGELVKNLLEKVGNVMDL